MAENGTIDQIANRAALDSDTQFIIGNLKSILDMIEKINSIKLNLGNSGSLKDTIAGAQEAQAAIIGLQGAKESLLKSDLVQAKVSKELALALKAEAAARKEDANAAKAEAQASTEASKAELNNAKTAKESAAAEKLLAQARKENAIAAQKERQEAEAAERAQNRAKNGLSEHARIYAEFSKAAREASLKAKAYALTLGEDSEATKAAVKHAKELNDQMKRIDALVGQHGRNVGNYASAFDGLGMSFTQVARELPSLTISVQQFVLAISNNLPMVADEWAKASAQIKAAKEAGEQVPSMTKRVISALFSLNVGLSVGIALLTAYSGQIVEWINSLGDGSIQLRKAALAQEAYNEARKKGIENERDYAEVFKNDHDDPFLARAKSELNTLRAQGATQEDILKKEREIASIRFERAKGDYIAPVEFLGKKTGGSEEWLEKTKQDLDKAERAYQKFLKTGEAYGKTMKPGTADYKEADQLLKNSFDFNTFLYNDQLRKITEYYDSKEDLRVKDLEIEKAEKDNRVGFFADELQYRADNLRSISELEDAGAKTRINARKEAYNNEKLILEGGLSDELIAAKGNSAKKIEVIRAYSFQRKKLSEELAKDIQMIENSSRAYDMEREKADQEMALSDFKDIQNARIKAIQDALDKEQKELAEGKELEVKSLNRRYSDELEATKNNLKKRAQVDIKYAKERAEIEYRYAIAAIKDQIDALGLLIKAKKDNNEEVANDEKALAELKMKLDDEVLKHQQGNDKKRTQSGKLTMDDIQKGLKSLQDIEGKVADLIGSAISQNADAKKAQIDREIESIDKKRDREIAAIDASALSQAEKDEAKIKANARADAQKDALEKKQRQLDLQRARFDKASAIAKIIINTAVAVTGALAQQNYFAAVAYGALGAAELAIAVAQPLPKFKDGREKGPATWAIVGDGGVNEVISSPDLKQSFITPARDTLTYLPEDWKVFKSMDAYQNAAGAIANQPLPAMPSVAAGNDDMIHAMSHEIGSLKSAIMGKQENYISLQNGEFKRAVKIGNDWIRYIQNNV